jgi:large subunit ribosomal protein L25
MPRFTDHAAFYKLEEIMADVLQVDDRKLFGKLNNRRLRRSGKLPAVLYGHQKPSVSLSLNEDELSAMIRHGVQVVSLQGAASGHALLQEVHWDTFKRHPLHVDLLRVDISQRVQVEIPILLRGDAPGTHDGGIVEQLIRTITIETNPTAIPENLQININNLGLNDSLEITAIEDLPEGATIVTDSTKIAVHCVEPVAELEGEDGESGGVEPEIIGRKAEEEQENES